MDRILEWKRRLEAMDERLEYVDRMYIASYIPVLQRRVLEGTVRCTDAQIACLGQYDHNYYSKRQQFIPAAATPFLLHCKVLHNDLAGALAQSQSHSLMEKVALPRTSISLDTIWLEDQAVVGCYDRD